MFVDGMEFDEIVSGDCGDILGLAKTQFNFQFEEIGSNRLTQDKLD